MLDNGKCLFELVIVAVVGFIYHYLVLVLWGFLPFINPITSALFDCCTTESWYRALIWGHDVLVNVALQLPLAYLLLRLNSNRVIGLLAIALLPSLVYWNYHLFWPELIDVLSFDLMSGLLMEYLSLPIATILLIVVFNVNASIRLVSTD